MICDTEQVIVADKVPNSGYCISRLIPKTLSEPHFKVIEDLLLLWFKLLLLAQVFAACPITQAFIWVTVHSATLYAVNVWSGGCAWSTLCRFFMSFGSTWLICTSCIVRSPPSRPFIALYPFAKLGSIGRDGVRFWVGEGRRGMNSSTCHTRLIQHFNVIVLPSSVCSESESNTSPPSSSNWDILFGLTRPRFVSRHSLFITLNQFENMSLTTRLSQTSFAGYWMDILALEYLSLRSFFFFQECFSGIDYLPWTVTVNSKWGPL